MRAALINVRIPTELPNGQAKSTKPEHCVWTESKDLKGGEKNKKQKQHYKIAVFSEEQGQGEAATTGLNYNS